MLDYSKKTFTVKARRDLSVSVSEKGECVDGLTHTFTAGWIMGEGDPKHYQGEIAYIPDFKDWPACGPAWIAEGDLIPATKETK